MSLAAPKPIAMYLGTYTAKDGSQGIYRTSLDRETGAIAAPVLVAEAENPSYLALAGDRLYACLETESGGAAAYRIGKDGGLSALNERQGLGSYPCHLAVADGHLLVANYGAGSVAALPIERQGTLGRPLAFENRGSGPNIARQDGPHLHFVQAHNGFVYACDLGTDEILTFPLDAKPFDAPTRTRLHPGAGPRHLAFTKGFVYANNELDNTVTTFSVDPQFGALTAIGTVSSLPEGFKGASHSAEIAVHPNGRWLYVSNRGHDSLALFEIGADGTLRPVEVKAAGVKEPRGFGIDPSGRWLVVGGQNDDTLVSLPIDPSTGRLGDPKGHAKVGKPVCVVFKGP